MSELPPTRPPGIETEVWNIIRLAHEGPAGSEMRQLAHALLQENNRVRELLNEKSSVDHRLHTAERQLTTVGEELMEEAKRRNWCEEYDAFARRVNTTLGREVLQLVPREYIYTFAISVVHTNTDPSGHTDEITDRLKEKLAGLEGLSGVEFEDWETS